jgi:hypothetical protein
MSWVGQRPLSPDAATGFIHPYQNQSLMDVPSQDLRLTHVILAVGGACALLAVAARQADRWLIRRKAST